MAMLVSRIRRALGVLLQLVQRDQLLELSDQTRRLGSASVESISYFGGELRAVEKRLSKVEEELAALRRLLEEGRSAPAEPAERPNRVSAGPPNGG